MIGLVILAAAAVLLALLVLLCAGGIIGPNNAVGIRLPALLRSHDAWIRGHRAAVRPLLVAAGVAVVFLAVSAAMPSMVPISTLIVFLALIGGVVLGTILAGRTTGGV